MEASATPAPTAHAPQGRGGFFTLNVATPLPAVAPPCPWGRAQPLNPIQRALTRLPTHLTGTSPTFLPSLETYNPVSLNCLISPKADKRSHFPALTHTDPSAQDMPQPPFLPRLPQLGGPLLGVLPTSRLIKHVLGARTAPGASTPQPCPSRAHCLVMAHVYMTPGAQRGRPGLSRSSWSPQHTTDAWPAQ